MDVLPDARRTAGAVLCLLLLFTSSVAAQSVDDLPPVTDTYVLTDARVVQAPGEVLDPATVLVRDGLIEAVGSDVSIPYDAREIDADSLVVYAGFVDGLSHAGVSMPESQGASDDGDDNGSEVEDPGDPPMDRAGIQPDRAVQRFLSPDEKTLSELRKIGFTSGHVVPEGQMLPGTGAIVQYGGDTGSDMVLEQRPSLFAQIKTADGYIYPATDMAVIATMRQLYREAARRQDLQEAYRENPDGRRRPPQDPVHSALTPVLDGSLPMAFYADDVLSIHRILNLQNELGFPLLLAGLAESHAAIESIEGTDAPLFLTLDLPEEPTRSAESDTIAADTTDRPSRFYDPDLRTASYRDVSAEEENLELRHAAERKKYLRTAAMLEEAGLPFGFTTREADAGDIRSHLRTMIEEGLSEDAALAALTTRPASLLGLERRLGTVEDGKIANLVVTDGSYFEEDTSVRYVFVDGRLYDYASESEEGEVTGEASAVVGTWSYTLETSQGDFSGTIEIEGDASGLSGTFVGPQGDEQDLQSVSWDGTTLSFSVDSPQGGSATVSVTVEGETFDGSVSGSGQSFSISGERTSSPDR
jgi:hypothetical protein